MINSAAIITVRALSTRLKKKCFQKLAKNKSMIEIVTERSKKIGCKVILATSNDKSDDDLEKIAKDNNILIFRGSLNNKIHRWKSCFDEFNLEYAATIDADDPSFSFSLVRKALEQLKNSDADMFLGDETLMPGFITFGFSKVGINKLFNEAKDKDTNTDVIDVFLQRAKLKKIFIKPNDAEISVNQVRLTVDYDEDVEFYRQLFKHVSYLEESDIVLKEIILRNLNKINWFRHLEFKKNQENFNNSVI